MAIEDRRFYSHWGIDPRGIARAAWANIGAGGVREGGSTITQQLAKNAFLDSDRTAARKIREVAISFWLEAWLSKDEILSRYLSNVYFGDNCYGLTAAAQHYFGRTPEALNIGQAAMLAGLVKAPSRLAPTSNLVGARKREMVVVGAMVDAGFLTKAAGDDVQPQRVRGDTATTRLPSGTYFADWVLPEARDQAGEVRTEATVETTLDRDLQRSAERVVRQAGLRQAQVALVAMRRDGRIVAMVGGKDYGKSPFNRATQARRQPGSTFKLFVYLAAMRAGMTPDSMVDDSPVEISGWKPKNDDGRYLGAITLRRAFARSSNVAARAADAGGRGSERDQGSARSRHLHPDPERGDDRARHRGGIAARTDRGLCRRRQRELSRPAARAGACRRQKLVSVAGGGIEDAPRNGPSGDARPARRVDTGDGARGGVIGRQLRQDGDDAGQSRRVVHRLCGRSGRGCVGSATTTIRPIRAFTAAASPPSSGAISWSPRWICAQSSRPPRSRTSIPRRSWPPDIDESDDNEDAPIPDAPPIEGTVRGFGLEMKMGRDGTISINPADERGRPPPREPRRSEDAPRRSEDGPPGGF